MKTTLVIKVSVPLRGFSWWKLHHLKHRLDEDSIEDFRKSHCGYSLTFSGRTSVIGVNLSLKSFPD
ncbi:MAG: hypothetical protein RLO19_14390 [Coleofasciculus sp. G2-EDA-02]